VQLTLTVTFAGAVPLPGLTVSQPPPALVELLTVKFAPEGALVTVTTCAAGGTPGR
jgi:hypothetical protein